jgi:hypothetical protein
LYAGLGVAFLVEEIKIAAKEGDIVLLSIEYFVSTEGQYDIKKHTTDFYFNPFEKKQTNLLEYLEGHLKETQRNLKKFDFFGLLKNDEYTKKDSIYARTSFNKHGDMVAHLDQPSLKNLRDRKKLTYKYWRGIDELNSLAEFARKNKVMLFFIFPTYPKSEYKNNKEVINQFEADIRSDLKIPVLSDAEDFIFDDSYFFDTIYHLNKLGRQKRTEMLISILKASPFVMQGVRNMREKGSINSN